VYSFLLFFFCRNVGKRDRGFVGWVGLFPRKKYTPLKEIRECESNDEESYI